MHPTAIGRRVQLTADLQHVVVTCERIEVARHPRCWAAHQSITDPAHQTAALAMRQSRRLSVLRPVDTAVEHRSLTDYDRMFGLGEETA